MRYWDVDDANEDDFPTSAELVDRDARNEAEIDRRLEARPWRQCEECEDRTQHDTEFPERCAECQTIYDYKEDPSEDPAEGLQRGFIDMQGEL